MGIPDIYCRQLELARFHISKNSFTAAAKSVEREIASSEDTGSGRHYLKFPQSMLNLGYGGVDYSKKWDSVAILFPVSQSFSTVRYFAYLSGPQARNLLENPREYGFERDGYNRVEELDGSQWVYVFYWGDIRPRDPNL